MYELWMNKINRGYLCDDSSNWPPLLMLLQTSSSYFLLKTPPPKSSFHSLSNSARNIIFLTFLLIINIRQHPRCPSSIKSSAEVRKRPSKHLPLPPPNHKPRKLLRKRSRSKPHWMTSMWRSRPSKRRKRNSTIKSKYWRARPKNWSQPTRKKTPRSMWRKQLKCKNKPKYACVELELHPKEESPRGQEVPTRTSRHGHGDHWCPWHCGRPPQRTRKILLKVAGHHLGRRIGEDAAEGDRR